MRKTSGFPALEPIDPRVSASPQKITAVATAMVAYDRRASARSWRELAAVALEAAEAFERLEAQAREEGMVGRGAPPVLSD